MKLNDHSKTASTNTADHLTNLLTLSNPPQFQDPFLTNNLTTNDISPIPLELINCTLYISIRKARVTKLITGGDTLQPSGLNKKLKTRCHLMLFSLIYLFHIMSYVQNLLKFWWSNDSILACWRWDWPRWPIYHLISNARCSWNKLLNISRMYTYSTNKCCRC